MYFIDSIWCLQFLFSAITFTYSDKVTSSKLIMTSNSKINKPATMNDVARLAGVSQPTVSRILSNKNTFHSISEETRTRVLAVAKELNYQPNLLAQGLRTSKTQMIAVMIADISNNFYHRIVRAIQDFADEENYDVMIANSDHIYRSEKKFLSAVSRRPVDGVIMVPIHLTEEEINTFSNQTHTPVVVLGQQIVLPNVDVVFVDDEQAIYSATRWLVEEQGYQSIGYVGVTEDFPPGPRRYRGFQRAMGDLQMPINPDFIIESNFTVEGGMQVANQLIQRGTLPKSLVVINDLMAMGVLVTLLDAGYRVPEDIAILGFDDIKEATLIRPTLSTIAQDPYDMGQKLSKLLFERIENPKLPSRQVESSLKLIKRDSA